MASIFSCIVVGMERCSLDLIQTVKNMVRCGSVWTL